MDGMKTDHELWMDHWSKRQTIPYDEKVADGRTEEYIAFLAGYAAGRSSALHEIVTKANEIERLTQPVATGILRSCDCGCHKHENR